MSQEIFEDGVSSIEMSKTAFSNRIFTPYNGRVKWFVDELGQKWTKFSTGDEDALVDHVSPADLVVEVVYIK